MVTKWEQCCRTGNRHCKVSSCCYSRTLSKCWHAFYVSTHCPSMLQGLSCFHFSSRNIEVVFRFPSLWRLGRHLNKSLCRKDPWIQASLPTHCPLTRQSDMVDAREVSWGQEAVFQPELALALQPPEPQKGAASGPPKMDCIISRHTSCQGIVPPSCVFLVMASESRVTEAPPREIFKTVWRRRK